MITYSFDWIIMYLLNHKVKHASKYIGMNMDNCMTHEKV